jgi:hypothetical protein
LAPGERQQEALSLARKSRSIGPGATAPGSPTAFR